MTTTSAPRARGAWLREQPISRRASSSPAWVNVAVAAAAVLYVAMTMIAISGGDPVVLGAVVVVPPIFGITFVIAKLIAERDHDPGVVPLVIGAFAVKMLGTAARYWTAYSIYDGSIDASVYDRRGRAIAAQWRATNFTFDVGGRLAGTNFVKLLTGIVYTVTPATRISGFIVCSWIAFIGLLLYWRAFHLAVPTGNSRKYALLVLLLPSLVYWPSSIGKEAWMTLGLGLTAYGAARISSARTATGVLAIVGSMVIVIGVRPHIAICVFVGLTVMMLIIGTQWRRMRRPIMPVLAVLALALVGNVAVQRAQSYLGVDSLTQESITQTLDSTVQRSSTGGSEFTPVRVTNPVKFPLGFATVFYRPFPFEVHNAQQLLTAAEGLVLIGATLASRRSIASVLRMLRQVPYIAYCVAFVVTFVIAFSAFSNFGLLARQRTQVLPLYLALLALPRRALGAERDAPDALEPLEFDDATA